MEHHRKNPRASWHNYQNGTFFITVCTKNKQHYFGSIYNEKMHLSQLGIKLDEIISQTINIRKSQHIEIPIYVIMPNHFHILITLNTDFDIPQHHFHSSTQNISAIIRGIKSALSSYAKQNHIPFEWQSKFYDRIVRNEREFHHIYEYIQNNVINWNNDELF